MINKLRRQFIRIAMLSVTLVLVGLILAVNIINFMSVNGDLNRLLTILSDNGGVLPRAPEGKPGDRRKDPHMTAETPFSTRYFVLRYTAAGELLRADLDHIAAVTAGDAQSYADIALRHGIGTGYTGAYIYRVTADGAGGFMAVFLNCQGEVHALRTFAAGSAAAGGGCILLVYVLILFFSQKAITPAVQSIERQKQFITDAGHELKTPLTVISTSQKVLEMEVGQQKWIDKTLAQVDRLRELVDELVTLSRLDEEHPPLKITRFDVSAMVLETAESFVDYAAARGHRLDADIPGDLRLCGDPMAVQRLVSVLLDNAVKYSTEGGSIRLRLEGSKKGVRLTVQNDCQPIEPAQLERLFDRFYRLDKSRTRQTGGFGVGLSIARSIAEAHHGAIRAVCPEARVIQFIAVLNNLKPDKAQ